MAKRKAFVVCLAVSFFGGCTEPFGELPPPEQPEPDPQHSCDTDADCDDENPCTTGSCVELSGARECAHEEVACDNPDFVCDEDSGDCVCDEDEDCDDGVFCTGQELCDDGQCELGNQPCDAAEFCDEEGAECVECLADADCDDGLYCNGKETCDEGACLAGEEPCDADEFCSESADECDECITGADCDDDLFCNGKESCSDGGCKSGSSPCKANQECDEDEDACFIPFETIQNATWLVLAWSDHTPLLVATAFGVSSTVFATNAHVSEGLKDVFSEANAQAYVVQHETGAYRLISKVCSHPEYDGDFTSSPDVGLIGAEFSGPNSGNFDPVTIADGSTLHGLSVFDTVSSCGFPADVLNIDLVTTGDLRPRATCLQGTISALRPLDPSEPATPQNTCLIQYDLPVSQGTSGSAVFNDRGEIIGINSFMAISPGDFNFAIRSDKLVELIEWSQDGTAPWVILDDIPLKPTCNTSFYDPVWRFGFNVPSGFVGPFAYDSSALYAAEWLFDQIIRIQVEVWPQLFETLQEQVDAVKDFRQQQGYELVQQQLLDSSVGEPFYLMEWRFASLDVYIIESWTMGRDGFYGVMAFFDLPLMKSTMEAAAKSICTD